MHPAGIEIADVTVESGTAARQPAGVSDVDVRSPGDAGALPSPRAISLITALSSSFTLRLHRFPRLRSFRYFMVEAHKCLLDIGNRSRRRLDSEYRASIDPLGYARECEQRRFKRALQMLDEVRGNRTFHNAVEVGCGEGAFTAMLADRCDALLAVDLSPAAVQRAAPRCSHQRHVRFSEFDIRRHALGGERDLIVAVGVLEYIYRTGVLRRVRRQLIAALRPGGYLLVGNTVRCPVVEKSSWVRWLPRGTRLNTFIAEHPQVRLVSSSTEEYALPFQHILVQKIASGGAA